MMSHDILHVRHSLTVHQTKSQGAIENVFPDVLKEPILRKVQFSTISRIDDLGEPGKTDQSLLS